MAGATLTFTAPWTPGTYNVRWFAQDGFTRLAISADVTVTAPPAPTVTITTSTVSGGGAIGFTVANGPANTTDWVGLFPSAAPDTGYVAWSYLSGTKTPPASGMADATLTLTAPRTPGAYNVRWVAQGGFTRLATSGTVTVPERPPPPLARRRSSFTLEGRIIVRTLQIEHQARKGLVTTCRGLDISTPKGRLKFSCSVGVAEATETDASVEDMMRRGDAALYEAKRGGRDGWRSA